MEWWIALIAVLAAVVLLGVATVLGRRAQERRVGSQRAEATELRAEAAEQAEQADERARRAAEQADQADRERIAAEQRASRADDVDPDVER